MVRLYTLLFFLSAHLYAAAQVKSEHIYNTSTPFGTLDLRTHIDANTYYYLEEGKTFAFRESSPGVRTNSFLDMTTWDSNPYQQGHLRKKQGAQDKFIMNYRLLPPSNYNSNYTDGYPLIVLLHGAVERGNCYYEACYHADWSYDPNANNPPAPTAIDHKLLNNDHHLIMGGKQHLQARDLAGNKLPNDASLPPRAFPGFVLIPQMLNVWDSLVVEDVIRLVRLHAEQYNIDENRIYIHGLSIGGYATYEAIKRAPWLFTAALPMSAVTEAANIFRHQQAEKVSHIPLWVFQGGIDPDPTPQFTEAVVAKFKNAGAIVRYTLYPSSGHRVWDKAYGEPDFFTWMLTKNKSDIHALSGITAIDVSKNQYPKLTLAQGFFAYQWEKDGVIISGATSHTYIATAPGTYRARFSRVSATPAANQWNRWSAPLTVTGTASGGDDGSGDNDGDDGSGDDGSDNDGGDDGSDNDDDSGDDDGGSDDNDDGSGDDGSGDDGSDNDGDQDGEDNDDGSGSDSDGDDGSGDDGGNNDDGSGEDGGDDGSGGDNDGDDGSGDDGSDNDGGDDGSDNDGNSGDDDSGSDDNDDGSGSDNEDDDGSGDDGSGDDGSDNDGDQDGEDNDDGSGSDSDGDDGSGDDGGNNDDGSGEDGGGDGSGGDNDGDDESGDDGSDNDGGDDGSDNDGNSGDDGGGSDDNDDGSGSDNEDDDGSGDDGSGDDGSDNDGGSDNDDGSGSDSAGDDGSGDNNGDDGGSDNDGSSGDDDNGNGDDNDNGPDDPITNVEETEPFKVSIYPNPSEDGNVTIHFESHQGKEIHVRIINFLGAVVLDETYLPGSILNNTIRPQTRLSAGMHLILVTTPDSSISERLIVK